MRSRAVDEHARLIGPASQCSSKGFAARLGDVRLFEQDLTKSQPGIWTTGFPFTCGQCTPVTGYGPVFDVMFRTSLKRTTDKPKDWDRAAASAKWAIGYEWDCCNDNQAHTYRWRLGVDDELGHAEMDSRGSWAGGVLPPHCAFGFAFPAIPKPHPPVLRIPPRP